MSACATCGQPAAGWLPRTCAECGQRLCDAIACYTRTAPADYCLPCGTEAREGRAALALLDKELLHAELDRDSLQQRLYDAAHNIEKIERERDELRSHVQPRAVPAGPLPGQTRLLAAVS